MTNYELAYLFSENVILLTNLLYQNSSIIFAFVAVSSVAATRLSRNLSILAVALFSISQLLSGIAITRAAVTFSGIASRLREAGNIEGSDLAWHAVVTAPSILHTLIPYLSAFLCLIMYLGAVYFFILCGRGEFRLPA